MNKKYTFHVSGMHCKACTLFIESELAELANVSKVTVSLDKHLVEVEGDFADKTDKEVASELSKRVSSGGYVISNESRVVDKKLGEFKLAVPITLAIILLFFLLQKLGIVNLVNASSIGYGTTFVVGVVASLSTCMAVVGGLLLSMSATFAKEGEAFRPQVMFHLGRLVAFFLLGGVIGALGTAFTLNSSLTFVLSLVIGLVMLILGLNLLDVFDWAKKLQPSMPKFISRHAHGVSRLNHTLTPLLVGVATFFLPCGFTQSMQLYTLTTGSFLSGALTMFVFALGTLPVLALISFSSFNIRGSKWTGVFFKTAGLVVIVFALFNLINSLAVVGLIPPLFNF